jgi:hypothetical protein
MASAEKTSWTTARTIESIRPQVRDVLTAIPAFETLAPDEKRRIAGDMVKVLSYIANPNGVVGADPAAPPSSAPPPVAPARGLEEDPVQTTKRNLARSPGFAGKDFVAGGVRQGVEQFGAMVKKVDFPKFVGGLIKNVFQAIVESSIEQMRAYGDLIANVAKTVDQYMQDNISVGAGRDWLAERYPDDFAVEVNTGAGSFAEGDTPPAATTTIVPKGDDPEQSALKASAELGVNPPVRDVSDPKEEMRLVTAARMQMARSRQQLLSSMVMLGINRIVVTDGSINAKVVFDMRASDTAKRKYTASMHDRSMQQQSSRASASFGAWYTPFDVSAEAQQSSEHVATVGSAVDENSESMAEVKAKLSGDVRVNFKSDYLPLEKMATPEMMSVIQGNSTPYNPNSPSSAGRAAT